MKTPRSVLRFEIDLHAACRARGVKTARAAAGTKRVCLAELQKLSPNHTHLLEKPFRRDFFESLAGLG